MGATSGPSCWEIFLSKQEAVEETPSRRDKMAKSIETHQRRNYVKLITDVCVKFGTNPEVPMIAASYCHRFYAAKSMVCNDYFTVATAALFLTFKVADLNPPLRKVLECSYNCHFSCDDASKKFLQDKGFYSAIKRKILQAERSLLYVIGFNFKPDLPVKYFGKKMGLFDFNENNQTTFRQICYNFASDTLKTTLWIQYPAMELAYAFMYLASKFMNIPLKEEEKDPEGKEWYEDNGMTPTRMKEITDQVLELYTDSNKNKRAKRRAAEPSRDAPPPKKQVAEPAAEPAADMAVPATPELPPNGIAIDAEGHNSVPEERPPVEGNAPRAMAVS
mmetsp:Transcript_14523/g.34481  ORF Transcript_14523/g.34481 Transcript_14523/m.34481 type:complete len:333 (+) Transcript_14523:549-1547(+)